VDEIFKQALAAPVQPVATLFGSLPVYDTTPPAQPAPVQPVAWGVFEGGNLHDMFFTKEEADNMAHLKGLHAEIRPLTTPPAAQRQWVGLSQDELDAMFSNTIKGKKLVNYVARAIEAKLKEKNT
jgi:hypothetical protein